MTKEFKAAWAFVRECVAFTLFAVSHVTKAAAEKVKP